MAGRACERLGSMRDESHWCLEGNDGNHASDNRSTEETSKTLLSQDRGRVGPGIRSLIIKGKARGM